MSSVLPTLRGTQEYYKILVHQFIYYHEIHFN